jgi:hypothetical protein
MVMKIAMIAITIMISISVNPGLAGLVFNTAPVS